MRAFKVGDLVQFSSKYPEHYNGITGVVVETYHSKIDEGLPHRYKVLWSSIEDSPHPIWYAPYHLERVE